LILYTPNIHNYNSCVGRRSRQDPVIACPHKCQHKRKRNGKAARNDKSPVLAVQEVNQDDGGQEEGTTEEGDDEAGDRINDAVDDDWGFAEPSCGPFAVKGAAELGGLTDGDGFWEDAEEEAAEGVDGGGRGCDVDEVANAGGEGGGGLLGGASVVAVFALGHFVEGLGPTVFLKSIEIVFHEETRCLPLVFSHTILVASISFKELGLVVSQDLALQLIEIKKGAASVNAHCLTESQVMNLVGFDLAKWEWIHVI